MTQSKDKMWETNQWKKNLKRQSENQTILAKWNLENGKENMNSKNVMF